MYLHIVDDAKTINHFIRRVNEPALDNHHFLVITPSGQLSQISPIREMTLFVPSTENIRKIARTLPIYKAVFIHNLCYTKARIILQAKKDILFVWGIWGYDYYYVYPELYRHLFMPYTQLANVILGKLSLSDKFIKYHIHPLAQHFGLKSKERIQQQAAKRINFTFNNMPRHSDVFRMLHIKESRRFHLSYFSIEFITEGLAGTQDKLGENIYIGNSASNSSNHIDAFLHIKSHTGSKNIIVPLGYGCPRYRSIINLAGRAIFQNHFKPINKHIPLNEYNTELLKCNVMIFNHKRAQGLGSILFGVWAGHKIFLRPSNPVYSYLKSLGIMVYPIESKWPARSFEPLAKEWKLHNRNIIETWYGEDSVKSELKSLLDRIEKENSNSLVLND